MKGSYRTFRSLWGGSGVATLAVPCALTLMGCIEPVMQWRKDGATPDQAKYDKAVCEYNAEIQAGPVGSLNGDQRAARKEQVKKMSSLCLTARGYQFEQVAIDP